MSQAQKIAAAFLLVVNAVVTLLVSLGAVDWTDAQVVLVYAAANTGTALVVALYLHFAPGTKKQPVAIAGAFTAFTTAVLGLLVGFHAFELTDAQIGMVIVLETSLVGLVTTTLARNSVTAPVTPELERAA